MLIDIKFYIPGMVMCLSRFNSAYNGRYTRGVSINLIVVVEHTFIPVIHKFTLHLNRYQLSTIFNNSFNILIMKTLYLLVILAGIITVYRGYGLFSNVRNFLDAISPNTQYFWPGGNFGVETVKSPSYKTHIQTISTCLISECN